MLLYIAGPITPNSQNGKTLKENLKQLSDIALEVWRAGHAAINPGGNTDFIGHEFNAGLEAEVFYRGDLIMLARCDGIVLTPDWETSVGACEEANLAESIGMPIYIYPELPEPVIPKELVG